MALIFKTLPHKLSVSVCVCLCVIYWFVYVSHICVCTSCHWQVACSGWWIITILYTSNIRNANISFHLKPHFSSIFTSCIIWQEHLLLIHAPQTFLSEWKNFCNVFLWHSRGCTAIFWLFSFQHKHRLTNKKNCNLIWRRNSQNT